MIDVWSITEPHVPFWDTAIKGMRNAFGSWKKSDSFDCYGEVFNNDFADAECETCPYCRKKLIEETREELEAIGEEPEYEYSCHYYGDGWSTFVLGDNDYKLLMGLCKAGDASHRKVLRQLPVTMDIRAPLYWWKQMDTYKVGTVANSESTMHTLTKRPFELSDFSLEYLEKVAEPLDLGTYENFFNSFILSDLNYLRDKYLETKDTNYWYALNQILPQSYMQKRTWSANYEVLVNIIKNRVDHKLGEWRGLIRVWLNTLPYLLDITLAMGILKVNGDEIEFYDTHNQEWLPLMPIGKDTPISSKFYMPGDELWIR